MEQPNESEQKKDSEDPQKSEKKLPQKKEEILVNNIKADGGAYKGKPKNDYCLHFVETGERPQNFIRDYEEDKRFLDYPKLFIIFADITTYPKNIWRYKNLSAITKRRLASRHHCLCCLDTVTSQWQKQKR